MRRVSIGAGVLTVLVFLLGFKAPSMYSTAIRTEQCRFELNAGERPPWTQRPELSSEVLPVRTVCTWPGGLTAEVRHPLADDLTLRLLGITLLTGLLSATARVVAGRQAAAPKEAARPPGRSTEGKPSA
jgi:hypothetical protein